MATVRIRAGAPPGQEAERPTGQGEAFEMLLSLGMGTRNDDNTNLSRWAAYVARRRLRRKRAGSRWPAEEVS